MLCDGNLFCQPRPPEYYVGEVWKCNDFIFVITGIDESVVHVRTVESRSLFPQSSVPPQFMFRCEKIGEIAEVKGKYS